MDRNRPSLKRINKYLVTGGIGCDFNINVVVTSLPDQFNSIKTTFINHDLWPCALECSIETRQNVSSPGQGGSCNLILASEGILDFVNLRVGVLQCPLSAC